MTRLFRYGLELRVMINAGLLFFIGGYLVALGVYYLVEAIQLQHLLDEKRAIAYVVVAFISISAYLLGVLAMYLHVRWYRKHVAYVFSPKSNKTAEELIEELKNREN